MQRKQEKTRKVFTLRGKSMVKRKNITQRPQEIWQAALEECDRGMAKREVARLYHILESTLRDRLKNRNMPKPGHQQVLTEAEEARLVQHIISMSKLHLPLDMDMIREIAGDIVSQSDRPNRFISKVASE